MDTYNFDLNNCTRNGLCIVLKTARNEIAKYNSCSQKVKECEKNIEDFTNKLNFRPLIINGVDWASLKSMGCFALLIAILAFVFFAIPIYLILCPFEYIYHTIVKKPKTLNNIQKFSQNLGGLQTNRSVAISEFKATWLIPQKYWNEYALSTMLEYVEDREASNWERVTDLYKTHLHRLNVENNSRIAAEQSQLQAEYAKEGRDAARWAAAGAWAAAAGIWRH